jgi:hypothetical protein
MYDPEATIQDADIEMADAYELSRIVEARRRAGICSHTSSRGRGPVLCTDICGRTFPNVEAMYDDAGIY